MTVQACGTWGKPDVNGKRVFTYGKTPLAIGNVVRVQGYGYGATKEECGKDGVVVAIRTKRVTVEFNDSKRRNINGVVLARVVQVWED